MDGLGAEAAPTHAFEVHAAGFGRVAEDRDVGRDVLADGGAHAGEGVGADPAVLVHQGVAGQDRPVVHVDMPRQRRVVHQDAMVADHAVMADVGIGHDQVVVANGGFRAVLDGSAMDGHALADHVVVTDHQARRLALVLQVGGILADAGELEDAVVLADLRGALEHHVGTDHRPFTDLHFRPDDGPRAHLDVGRQPGARVDDGARIDQTHSLRSAQMISAEHTGLSSTVAWQSNFQMLRFTLMNLACSCSWSPGRTGWRKRSLSEPTK